MGQGRIGQLSRQLEEKIVVLVVIFPQFYTFFSQWKTKDWNNACAHRPSLSLPSKTRHVYLLSPHFLHHVSIESQKAEFAALLDSISEPSKESAADAASVLCRVLPERTSRSSNSNSNISRVVG